MLGNHYVIVLALQTVLCPQEEINTFSKKNKANAADGVPYLNSPDDIYLVISSF